MKIQIGQYGSRAGRNITRKQKLFENRRQDNKRRRNLSGSEISQPAFLALLKIDASRERDDTFIIAVSS